MTITERLIPILQRAISDGDRKRAALLLLDWTGCAVAGRAEPAGEKFAAAFPGEAGACTRIGSSNSSPLMAALHNGCLGNVLEMDDVDRKAVLHAAPTIMPAALAMAQYVDASVSDFLDAIIIGYEATIRVGRAVGAGHYAYWHNTATCGPFGAAAAACHLLKGSDPVSALGLAGTQAAGLWQTRHEPDSMAKQLHAGHAAHAGVLAAMLSAQGFQGPRTILEGEQGFFAAMCPGADPEEVLVNSDGGWLIHETSLKPYPACRHAHPAIDAALGLMKMDGFNCEGETLLDTYSDALKFCDNPNPATTIEAKFSIQHNVALVLGGYPINLQGFAPDMINDPKLSALRGRVKVQMDPDIQSRYPAQYGAAITVGHCHFETYDAYGDPEYSMDDDAVIQKASGLMRHGGFTKAKAARICNAALALAEGGALVDYKTLLS